MAVQLWHSPAQRTQAVPHFNTRGQGFFSQPCPLLKPPTSSATSPGWVSCTQSGSEAHFWSNWVKKQSAGEGRKGWQLVVGFLPPLNPNLFRNWGSATQPLPLYSCEGSHKMPAGRQHCSMQPCRGSRTTTLLSACTKFSPSKEMLKAPFFASSDADTKQRAAVGLSRKGACCSDLVLHRSSPRFQQQTVRIWKLESACWILCQL